MELVELSTTSLAEAMFQKLGLPKPVYQVHQLEQGGYRSQIKFYRTKEHFRAKERRTSLTTPICEDREASMNLAADLAIEYMETRESTVLVDYNYSQLKQQKMAYARLSSRLLEKSEEINKHNKTIKVMAREARDYVEEVQDASNKIHGLTDIALDSAAASSVCSLKQAILKIRDTIVALQNTTGTAYLSLLEKYIDTSNDVSDTGYGGLSAEDSDESYHQEMDDDYAHYVRSP